MIQTITTDSNCGYLTFLNDEKEDKIYPPLRMYKDKNFLFVDGKDQQQISISRNHFKVYVDGVLYTDLPTGETVLNVAVECVNDASGGGLLDPDAARKAQQLIQITEAEEANIELELINENLRKKGTTPVLTYFDDITSPDFGTFPFPTTLIGITLDVPAQAAEVAVFGPVVINTIEDYITLWNAQITGYVLEKKSATEVWIKDGVHAVSIAAGSSVSLTKQDTSGISYDGTTWTQALKDELDGELSNLDCILTCICDLKDTVTVIEAGLVDESCKEEIFCLDAGGVDLEAGNEVTDGFSFEYWDGSVWQTYLEDITGNIINNIGELLTLLNATQTHFEFYQLAGNKYPTIFNANVGIRSLDNDITCEFRNFFLEIDSSPYGELLVNLGAPQCVSNSDIVAAQIKIVADKLSKFVDGQPMTVVNGGLQTYTPPIANQAQLITGNNTGRDSFIFQCFENDCWLRFASATETPTVRKGIFIKKGSTLFYENTNQGRSYQGPISIINAVDGTSFNYVYTKFE